MGEKSMRNVQQTSKQAYWQIIPELSTRQKKVYKTIRKHKAINNTMIAKKLGTPINSITPRTHELRELGLVKKAFKAICPHTKRQTTFWKCAVKQTTLTTSQTHLSIQNKGGENRQESLRGNAKAGLMPNHFPESTPVSYNHTGATNE